MKGKSATDAIFALRKLQERYREELHCVFIDLKKDYDRVQREGLYWCMRDKAVLDKYIRLVKDMYLSMRNCSEVCCSNKRTICSGSRTSPRIRFQPFRVCQHDGFFDRKHQKKTPWQIMFADDVVLRASEKDVLELELEQRREAMENRGMKLSRPNTEYMCLNGMSLGNATLSDRCGHIFLWRNLQ